MIEIKIHYLILLLLAAIALGSIVTYSLTPKNPWSFSMGPHNNPFKNMKPKTTGGETIQDWIDPLVSGQKAD